MTTKDEALKLALEALEYISSHYMSLPKIGCMALAAVEEALAEQPAQQQEPTVEDNSQNWRGMDGTTAYWLIQRHADGWADIGKMMGEWLAANQAQPAQQYTDVSGAWTDYDITKLPPSAQQQEPMAGLRCKIIENCKSCQHSVGRMSCSLAYRDFDSLDRSPVPPEWCPLPLYTSPPASKPCEWQQEDSEHMPDTWRSDCGVLWTFTDGGPVENDMKHCCGCGAKLREKNA